MTSVKEKKGKERGSKLEEVKAIEVVALVMMVVVVVVGCVC